MSNSKVTAPDLESLHHLRLLLQKIPDTTNLQNVYHLSIHESAEHATLMRFPPGTSTITTGAGPDGFSQQQQDEKYQDGIILHGG
jgi:hypothetical protein